MDRLTDQHEDSGAGRLVSRTERQPGRRQWCQAAEGATNAPKRSAGPMRTVAQGEVELLLEGLADVDASGVEAARPCGAQSRNELGGAIALLGWRGRAHRA